MAETIAVMATPGDAGREIATRLQAAQYRIVEFHTLDALLSALRSGPVDLAIVPGLSLVEAVRSDVRGRDVPLMAIMSADDDAETITALWAGADDSLSAEPRPAILLARVSALIRRTAGWSDRVDPAAAAVVFDQERCVVTIDGEARALTEKEFRLAMVLFGNTHRALARTYLIEAVWGPAGRYGSRTLDTHLARLKSKLGLTPERGFNLDPVYGYGYRLRRSRGMTRRQAA